MANIHRYEPTFLLQDSDPEAILRAARLPASDIRHLLGVAPQTSLNEHIVQASEMLEQLNAQIEQMKAWKCDWEDLCTESAISEFETRCDVMQSEADADDVEKLKQTVLSLRSHATDAEALLTALMFRLLTTLSTFELLLLTYKNRADVSRLNLLVREELAGVRLSSCDDATTRVQKAGKILDDLIEMSREPVPESWIDEVERMEEHVASAAILDADAGIEEKFDFETETGDMETDAGADAQAAEWEAERIRLSVEAEKSHVEELTRRQELEEESIIARQVEANNLHKQEQVDLQLLAAEVPDSKDGERLLSKEDTEELETAYATHPHVIPHPVALRPSSIISTESSADGYNTDTTADWSAHTRTSSVATTAASPFSNRMGIVHEKESSADIPDTPCAVSPLSQIPRLTSPVGTLETTDVGIALDLDRVYRHNTDSSTFSPLQYSGTHSPSSISATQEFDINSIDEESPLQQRNRLESEILAKDRYRGRNLLSSHPHSSPSSSVGLDANDPKRLTVDVSSLRGALATAKTSEDSAPMSSQRSLDLKIQHILTTLSGSNLNIEPVEQSPASISKSSAYKLVTASTGSSLKEAGYGQTRKYILQRPNAPPQIIWVRIIAERVMVRVGGGWTDLAEWLSNYILYHSSNGAPLKAVSPGTPNSTLSPTSRSGHKKMDRLPINNTPLGTRTSTPGSGSKIPGLSPGTAGSGRSASSSGSASSTPTPLGMAGPVSSMEKGKMSSEKKAWVQKMLRQVGVGEPKKEDGDVSRKLFVGEIK
ncbi:hypothetical protein V1517DRAFT_23358 [Lipomyces orientalis]|uniref:Uncharacterized protein n=1 Tax=Lipomyces orientalis TaxID=1233043 RepID=A0ACC3TVK0_9ASCO